MKNGKFFTGLVMSNEEIKEKRGAAVCEKAELAYRRAKENLEEQIKEMERDREDILDFSATDANDLNVAKNFDAKDFVTKDTRLGLRLRDAQLQLEIVSKRYDELFVEGE
jgi:predicted DNA binding CopG/RHH family protein